MKFKLRRFVFLAILVAFSAWAGSKSLGMVVIAGGGLSIGYLLCWEDSNYVKKQVIR